MCDEVGFRSFDRFQKFENEMKINYGTKWDGCDSVRTVGAVWGC